MRTIFRTVIRIYGRDRATASTLFQRDTIPGKVGRQMQTWARMPEGRRALAHRSHLPCTPSAPMRQNGDGELGRVLVSSQRRGIPAWFERSRHVQRQR
ncbi:MAG: DUF3225 domain-containing protein [Acetobacteraceae bacterium]|nr:DUF3225 domain-containing protein [Acetobacteraceae bacterium]